MQRYSSHRHRKLMDESEYALRRACDSPSKHVSRIVNTIVGDSRTFKHWESNHAELLLPVAEQSNNKRQILALRNLEVQLVHRRALFDLIREQQVRGIARKKLFKLFRATRDYQDAVIAEHQQYMIAVSSRVSVDHLIDVMHDANSKRLINQYEELYADYFKMKCYLAITEERYFIELIRLTLKDAQEKIRKKRERIETELPRTQGSSFEREAILAQSGRYPILNYMVG